MRVLILSIYHDPEPIPKTGELARELHRRGHQVTVVTSYPHYPTGQLYPGYRLRPWSWETREGVSVLRTFIFPYHGTSAPLRILNYVSWMISSIAGAWLTPRCDVIYVWHPPLTVGVSAWVISKLKRAPFVYDVQDLWPESALASGLLRPGALVRFLYRLAGWVYGRPARILVVSAQAASSLRAQGVDPTKLVVVKHWIEDSDFARPAALDVRREFNLKPGFLVIFAGNLGLVQGLETVIEAAVRLRERNVQILLVGDGADRARLEQLVLTRGLDNVTFAGQHPARLMPTFFAAADALLVHLRPSEIAGHAIPAKTLAYFAAGKPIVCGVSGATADLVRDADAGVIVPPGNPEALAAGIQRLAEMPLSAREMLGANGRRYLSDHFAKQRVITDYENILFAAAREAHGRVESAKRA